jgi:hypothetical protein
MGIETSMLMHHPIKLPWNSFVGRRMRASCRTGDPILFSVGQIAPQNAWLIQINTKNMNCGGTYHLDILSNQ